MSGQGIQIGGKESQELAKESEKHPLSLLGMPQNSKLTAITYTKNLVQTHPGPVLTNLVPLSPREPILVDPVNIFS